MGCAVSVEILLGAGEVAAAVQVAAIRQAVNRESGITNLKAGKQDPMTTEIVGILGEFAFAKWQNLYPDLTTHLRSGTFDATLKGWGVDVKSTRNPSGELWVDARPDKRASVYVLVHVEYACARVLGWMFGHLVEQVAVTHTAPYRVPQSALYPPEKLLHIRPRSLEAIA
jgi:hypothetical protein